jgi:putative endonuclease
MPASAGMTVGVGTMGLKQFYVYIMASGKRGTIYTGVTSDLLSRVIQHKEHHFPGSFTDRYNVNQLVWYEIHEGAETAIRREKQIKWRRAWKVELIQKTNPTWRDLFNHLTS